MGSLIKVKCQICDEFYDAEMVGKVIYLHDCEERRRFEICKKCILICGCKNEKGSRLGIE